MILHNNAHYQNVKEKDGVADHNYTTDVDIDTGPSCVWVALFWCHPPCLSLLVGARFLCQRLGLFPTSLGCD